MAQEISMFPRYTQRENRTTNYVGFVLKYLYEESPTAFQRTLARLIDDEVLEVGPSFQQQKRRGDSIPDFLIEQPRFWVDFEVKRTDKFDADQVRRHVEGMSAPTDGDVSVLVLLGTATTNVENLVPDLVDEQSDNHVQVVATSFECLVEILRGESEGVSQQFRNMLDDFETFLDQEGLIPRWRRLLDVVNSGRLMHEVVDGGAYCCPDTGGPYSHQRARYLGAYSNKTVSPVAQIEGVVVVSRDPDGQLTTVVRWNNGDLTNKALERRALEFIASHGDRYAELNRVDLQVFLLGHRFPTDFRKDTPGGMRGKRYFWNIPRKVADASELAELLDGRVWSEWPDITEH